MLNMCKQHSCELFGNLQGIFLGPDKIQSVCPCDDDRVLKLHVPHRNPPLQQCEQNEAC